MTFATFTKNITLVSQESPIKKLDAAQKKDSSHYEVREV